MYCMKKCSTIHKVTRRYHYNRQEDIAKIHHMFVIFTCEDNIVVLFSNYCMHSCLLQHVCKQNYQISGDVIQCFLSVIDRYCTEYFRETYCKDIMHILEKKQSTWSHN